MFNILNKQKLTPDSFHLSTHVKTLENSDFFKNKRNYSLGWINKDKIYEIESLISYVEKDLEDLEEKYAVNQNFFVFLKVLLKNKTAYEEFVRSNPNLDEKLEELQNKLSKHLNEKEQFLLNSSRLKQLDIEISEKTELKKSKQLELNEIKKEIGSLQNQIDFAKKQLVDLEEYVKTYKAISIVEQTNILTYTAQFKTFDDLVEDFNKSKVEIAEVIKTIEKAMSNYLQFGDKNLSSSIQDLDRYVEIYDKFKNENLPQFKEQFKTMANEIFINGFSEIYRLLDVDSDQIVDQINKLNEVLKLSDYNKGTYIQISAKRTTDVEVKEFFKQIQLQGNILEDDQTRNQKEIERLRPLINRLKQQTVEDERWFNKVTDVRNHFQFIVTEYKVENGVEIKVENFENTNNKSGGQKEKLASALLGALAQLQFGMLKDGFAFLILDEAFHNSDAQFRDEALNLLKQTGLQLCLSNGNLDSTIINHVKNIAQANVQKKRVPRNGKGELIEAPLSFVDMFQKE